MVPSGRITRKLKLSGGIFVIGRKRSLRPSPLGEKAVGLQRNLYPSIYLKTPKEHNFSGFDFSFLEQLGTVNRNGLNNKSKKRCPPGLFFIFNKGRR